jgi:hypothetical protein
LETTDASRERNSAPNSDGYGIDSGEHVEVDMGTVKTCCSILNMNSFALFNVTMGNVDQLS